ncbi:hypothetical protein F444_00866 [Phytophthora nicotianae P1976]|uniref:Uncharacterized protein n=1 Tax=Phytophthora nicotianae P1976 TaxID=1317066 RepID=A0A081B2T1_PHYNI|nr:hypothetical protein F444_00866 [Phytophthora nicotianae P1976]
MCVAHTVSLPRAHTLIRQSEENVGRGANTVGALSDGDKSPFDGLTEEEKMVPTC